MVDKFGRGYTLAIVITICSTVLVAIVVAMDSRMVAHILPQWGKFELILVAAVVFPKELKKAFWKYVPGLKEEKTG